MLTLLSSFIRTIWDPILFHLLIRFEINTDRNYLFLSTFTSLVDDFSRPRNLDHSCRTRHPQDAAGRAEDIPRRLPNSSGNPWKALWSKEASEGRTGVPSDHSSGTS